VVVGRSNVCLISDWHVGILQAINTLQNGGDTFPPAWKDVHNWWCMRHMGANFHDHFKNKDLMDLFKRLASQNQERKFKTLRRMLDRLFAKHAGDNADPPATRPFSDWIRCVPKQKLALLYDTEGRRYGIQTTNNAESYNMIMRGVRSLPLVGIVEFILYGCAQYFRDHYMAVSPSLGNPAVLFGYKMTEYMVSKITKSRLHDVRVMGTMERRFEVTCKGRSNRGMHRNRMVHECVLAQDGTIHCSCYKPTLLHKSCSHVIAACREAGVQPGSFISAYYRKDTIAALWNQEVFAFAMVDTYVQENALKIYIPDLQQ